MLTSKNTNDNDNNNNDRIPIYIVCWDEDIHNPDTRLQIVNESQVFISSEEAGQYQLALDEDAKNHGWDLNKSGYIIKTLDLKQYDNPQKA